jgi:hypothetical protein
MRLIEKLKAKRDAAYQEYLKYQTTIETIENDTDFQKSSHQHAVSAMKGAHALRENQTEPRKTKAPWTPERRKKFQATMRAKAAGTTKAMRAAWTPERRAAQAKRIAKMNKLGLTGKKRPGPHARAKRRGEIRFTDVTVRARTGKNATPVRRAKWTAMDRAKRSAQVKATWTPERKAEYSAKMKAYYARQREAKAREAQAAS